MNLSNQKLALAGLAAAIGCTTLGRWGLSTPPVRERDVFMVFVGGLVAGLTIVRFLRMLRAPTRLPEAPPPPAPPKSKG